MNDHHHTLPTGHQLAKSRPDGALDLDRHEASP